jgi:hypothetical protein
MPIATAPPGNETATYAPLFVDVLQGASPATGDGVADDTTELQAFIDDAADTGATVLLGVHKITAPLEVPAGVRLQGRNGDSRLILPNAANYPAILIDNASRVQINHLRVTTAGTTASGACAVKVAGNAADVDLVDVRAESLFEGFRIVGGEGATPGVCDRVRLTRCYASNSGQYGFRVDEVDGLTLTDCVSNGSVLDGVKLRKLTQNVTILGGYFTGATGGDGLDAYAGGGLFTLQGGIYSDNAYNGITIKTDDLSVAAPEDWGIVANVNVAAVRCVSNGGNGLTVHRNGNVDELTEPLVKRVTVQGGIFNDNSGRGIYIRSRAITVAGAVIAGNGLEGIEVTDAALDVSLIGCQVAGNSVTSTAARDGIKIAGKRVQVLGGSSIGTDPDDATNDTDLGAGTKTQRYGIRLESTSSDVTISGISLKYNATASLNDQAQASTVMPFYSDDSTDPKIVLPNNRRVYFRTAAGTIASGIYYTASDGLNIGDSTNAASLNFLSAGTAFMFPKLACQGEVEIEGALNHDGSTVGFYGTTPVAKQTGVAVSAAGIHAALVNLGLIGA